MKTVLRKTLKGGFNSEITGIHSYQYVLFGIGNQSITNEFVLSVFHYVFVLHLLRNRPTVSRVSYESIAVIVYLIQ